MSIRTFGTARLVQWTAGTVAIAALLLALIQLKASAAPAATIVSWEELNAQLAAGSKMTLTASEYSHVPAYAHILETNDRALFNEMVRQGRFAFVAAAGVAAIEQSDHDAAFTAAMHALANAESPGNYEWGMFVQYLQQTKVPAEKTFIGQFEQLCGENQRHRGGMVVLVSILPTGLLDAWLRSQPQVRSASAESIVVARLFADYQTRPEGVPKWLKEKLATYRNIPGSARAVFAYYAELTEPDLKEMVTMVLEDQTLDDSEVLALLTSRKEYILRTIDLKNIKVDPKRSELIQRALHIKPPSATSPM